MPSYIPAGEVKKGAKTPAERQRKQIERLKQELSEEEFKKKI